MLIWFSVRACLFLCVAFVQKCQVTGGWCSVGWKDADRWEERVGGRWEYEKGVNHSEEWPYSFALEGLFSPCDPALCLFWCSSMTTAANHNAIGTTATTPRSVAWIVNKIVWSLFCCYRNSTFTVTQCCLILFLHPHNKFKYLLIMILKSTSGVVYCVSHIVYMASLTQSYHLQWFDLSGSLGASEPQRFVRSLEDTAVMQQNESGSPETEYRAEGVLTKGWS